MCSQEVILYTTQMNLTNNTPKMTFLAKIRENPIYEMQCFAIFLKGIISIR